MEFVAINTEKIAATGATITIEPTGSDTWRKSAELASKIANDVDYQEKFLKTTKFVNESSVEDGTGAITNLSQFVVEKYSNEPYFDSGVEHAAFLALVNEVKRKKRE